MSGSLPVPPKRIAVYGIDNCDSCRHARRWLTERGITHRFHDIRRDGLSRATLEDWLARIAWEELPNRRGQTWRRLPATSRDALRDAASLVELALLEPLILRRPVLDDGDSVLVGYSAEAYASHFSDAG